MGKFKCSICGIRENESWPAHYLRVVSSKKPKPFLCKAHRREKYLAENPHIIEQRLQNKLAVQERRNIRKQKRMERLQELKKFSNFVSTHEDPIRRKKEMEDRDRNQSRKWRATPEGQVIMRDAYARRRALVANALIEVDANEKKLIRKFYADRPQGYHVDHIIPLSKGGKHCLANLQYLSIYENLSKGDKIYAEEIERELGEQKISISWIQNKFKIKYEKAREIYLELVEHE